MQARLNCHARVGPKVDPLPFFWGGGGDIFIDIWVDLFAFVVGSWCIYFSFAPLTNSDWSRFPHGPCCLTFFRKKIFLRETIGSFLIQSPKGNFSPFFFWTSQKRSKFLQNASKSHSGLDFSWGSKTVLELDSVIVAFIILGKRI